MSAKDEVEKLLKAHKAVLLRGKKHLIYQLDNGKRFVTPNTPSDTAAWDNNLTDLKRVLGISAVHREGVRRIKKRTPKPIAPDWLDALPKREEELPPAFKSEWLGPPKLEPEPEDDKPLRNPIYVKRPFRSKGAHTTDRGFSYSPEVLRHANFLARTEGDAAMHNYLNQIRTGGTVEGQNGRSNLGSIEQFLEHWKQERKMWQGKEAEAKREIIRCDIVIQQAEKTLDLATAPSASLKVSNGHGGGRKRGSGKWTPVLQDVFANGPIARRDIYNVLFNRMPEVNKKSLYTQVSNWVRRGTIVDNDGMLSLVQH